MTVATAPRPAAPRIESTLGAAFVATVAREPDAVAVRTRDDDPSLTWAALAARVAAAAGGLRALGVRRGDRVALLTRNRPETWVADLAATLAGAAPFSLYATAPAADIEFAVADAGARTLVVERAFLERAGRAALPTLERIVVVDGEPGERPAGRAEGLTLDELERLGEPLDLALAAAEVDPDALATLIYTSGTTARPKGVELTHRNVMAAVRGWADVLPDRPRLISWLPAAHVMERVLHFAYAIATAGTVTTCPDPRQVADYLRGVRPDTFIAVPRVWEKLQAGAEAALAALPDERRAAAEAALAAGLQRVRLLAGGRPVPPELETAVAHADAALFAGLRERLGLDGLSIAGVGAAPTARETLEFFRAIGVELREGYALSESGGSGSVVPPGGPIGSVGRPLRGLELRLADDGEVLLRGEAVMTGYRNQPEATRATIDPDGWLRTGDLGALDAGGNLTIVGRKKEIVITAGGSNVSPARVESTLKAAGPLIGQVCAIGDRRPYMIALVALDAEAAAAFAARHELGAGSLAELAADERVAAAVGRDLARANERLTRVEQIKRFAIVPDDWAPGGRELTPTLKLRRRAIEQRYAALVDAVYACRAGHGVG